MKVMALIYGDEKTWEGAGDDERKAVYGRYRAFGESAGEKVVGGAELASTSAATTVRVRDGETIVTDGPFAETKELVAGFWMWQCKSLEEAIEWVKRCPNPTGTESEIEIRQVFEAEDFGAEFTPELREQEERLRAQIEKNQNE